MEVTRRRSSPSTEGRRRSELLPGAAAAAAAVGEGEGGAPASALGRMMLRISCSSGVYCAMVVAKDRRAERCVQAPSS